jgi:hypothetical protein
LLAALVGGGFALLGVLVGSRGERRRWMREARRAAYMDYAEAVHLLQGNALSPEDRPDAAQRMHRALTAIGLVGPAKVNEACVRISECLRAEPIDGLRLTHLYNTFIVHAIAALAPLSWYTVRARLAREPSDEAILASVPSLRPQRQEGPPTS